MTVPSMRQSPIEDSHRGDGYESTVYASGFPENVEKLMTLLANTALSAKRDAF